MRDLYDGIKETISLIEGDYDIIRIVDPINKSSITVKDNIIEHVKVPCYDFWKRGSSCNNCISMRAYKEKDIFIKIEYVSNKIFAVKATPIAINGKTYVLEMVKNISQNGRTFNKSDNLSIQKIIDEMNKDSIMDRVSGVYNREYINERLLVDIKNCKVYGYTLNVIKITIDYLKSIEYKYGKDVEDKVIQEFIKITKNLIIKNSDWIGRYNEDTFFTVLHDSKTIDILERIDYIFSDFIVKDKDINTKINTSFKIYCAKNEDLDAEKILTEMYEQFYGENKEIEYKDNSINNKESMSDLVSKIKELQEVLDAVCIAPKDEINYEKRLEISQYLDGLIVKYMKSTTSKK